jgi:hypothetical protein
LRSGWLSIEVEIIRATVCSGPCLRCLDSNGES